MITISNKQVTAFGGIHVIHRLLNSQKLQQFINDFLPNRDSRAQYFYSDLILSRLYTAVCGGKSAEDVHYIRESFECLKGLSMPSADTMLRMEDELSVPTIEEKPKPAVVHQININEQLNELLLSTITFLGLLSPENKDYCLDFDHQFIPSEKHDANWAYKNAKGYMPGVSAIDNIPVYLENRNGNSGVKYGQLRTIKAAFSALEKKGISPARFRADNGSYIKEICDFVHEKNTLFYVRTTQCSKLLYQASRLTDWKPCRIGVHKYEASSFEYEFGENTHRIVAYRRPNKTGIARLLTEDAQQYLFILTNDTEWTEQQVIDFYNQRGNSERLFDIQNNDFNWNQMPRSFMHQNTVYLIIMAICHVLYRWIVEKCSQICDFVKPNFRLKTFRFHFVNIAAKTVYRGRRWVVTLFTKKNIKQLQDSP